MRHRRPKLRLDTPCFSEQKVCPLLETGLAIAAIASVLLAAWIIWRRPTVRPRAMKEFARDLVEHPDYGAQLDEEMDQLARALAEARAAPPPTPAEIPGLIDDLLSDDCLRIRAADTRLGKVAAAAGPLLLAALDDPRATWTRADGVDSFDGAPAERLVRLLAAIPSRALGDRIGHLADHAEWYVRYRAIKARAALGRADDLPFVLG
jgi:hypothetical protein